MKILLSPAKSLNLSNTGFPISPTTPIFEKEAYKISRILHKKSTEAIAALMGVSKNIAALNKQRYADFREIPSDNPQARPAAYCFNGDVYAGLDVWTLPPEKLTALQEKVCILSGLYGLLRAFDLIQPYRLEMGTKMSFGRSPNITAFWRPKATKALNRELSENAILINLASNEYASAVDFKQIKATKIITPQFKDFRNGQYRTISFFAKKARGLMTRHLILSNASNEEDIISFKEAGYSFSERETKAPNQPVFIRGL